MRNLNIGFFGDGKCGSNALNKLLGGNKTDGISIKFVCIRNEGQGEEIKAIARNNAIDILKTHNVNSDEFLNRLRLYNADLFVVDSFDQIFRSELRSIPPLGVINCHSGKLPYYRGRCPIIWALINDEKEFGITVHYMDEGIDTGDIILQRTFRITDEDDLKTLSERDAAECGKIIYDAVKLIQSGETRPIHQNDIDPVGIYCGSRKPGDEIIDWSQTSREIFNFVRALCPPGPVAASYRGNDIIRVEKVREVKGSHIYKSIAGQVCGIGQYGPYVKTGDSFVEIIKYSSSGKRIRVGDRLKMSRNKK